MQDTITETNATHREDNRITLYAINFGKLMQNEEQFKRFLQLGNADMDIAKMQQLTADMPGFQVETQETVRVRFQ